MYVGCGGGGVGGRIIGRNAMWKVGKWEVEVGREREPGCRISLYHEQYTGSDNELAL